MNSPKQLKELFYDVLGYPQQYHMKVNPKTKQKERKVTTDADALESLAAMGYDIAKALHDFRRIGKLKGTYIDGLLARVSANGRLHTDFQQTFTLTGRLSSRDPNLQTGAAI